MEPIYELGHLPLSVVRAASHSRDAYTQPPIYGPLSRLFHQYKNDNYGMSVRRPRWHTITVGYNGEIPDAECWHHDGTIFDRPKWMLIWTNLISTHVLLPNGMETTIRPNVLTLIDNTACQHRAPLLTPWQCQRRYFLRQHLLLNASYTLTERDIELAKKRLARILAAAS